MAITAIAVVLALASPYVAETSKAPGYVTVSPVQALWLGERALEEHLDDHRQTTDSRMSLRVDRIGRKVARMSDRPGVLYNFMVLQGDVPNAESFPGGTVCVTEALVRFYKKDDELAFALGHELAHIAQQHNERKYQLEFMPALVEASEKSVVKLVRSSFSHGHELEADRYGALFAVRAGYEFSAGVKALRRLAKVYGAKAKDSEHPSFEQRIELLRSFQDELDEMVSRFHIGTEALEQKRPDDAIAALRYFVAEFPKATAGRVNLGMAYLARIRETAPPELAEELPILPDPGITIRSGGYDRRDLEAARTHFVWALESEPREVYALAGLALVHLRTNDFDIAENRLLEALDLQPRMPELLLLLGNTRFKSGDFDRALVRYHAALAEREGWPAARKNVALTLEQLGRPEEAVEVWRGLLPEPGLHEEALQRLRNLEDLRQPSAGPDSPGSQAFPTLSTNALRWPSILVRGSDEPVYTFGQRAQRVCVSLRLVVYSLRKTRFGIER